MQAEPRFSGGERGPVARPPAYNTAATQHTYSSVPVELRGLRPAWKGRVPTHAAGLSSPQGSWGVFLVLLIAECERFPEEAPARRESSACAWYGVFRANAGGAGFEPPP